MNEYRAPASLHTFELQIKRSRFITAVVPVAGREAAREALTSIQLERPDANHHCWAMVAGIPNDVFQQDQSDAGEPRGTAGKPMLNVLLHSGWGNTLVVVTRYFGGVKLGAGGLVRAYSQSVSEALAATVTKTVYLHEFVSVIMSYSELDSFEHRLQEIHATIEQRQFTDKVQLRIAYPATKHSALMELLAMFGAECLPTTLSQGSPS